MPDLVPTLSFDGVARAYGSRAVLDDISLRVRPGSICGLVGPNGAGKTTLMRIAVGLVRADRGTVTFDGRRYDELTSPLRTVGTVLGGPGGHPAMRVGRHLRVLTAAAGIDDRRAEEVLEMVGLAAESRTRLRELSLGMGQRLALAEALLGNPRYLILDEPFGGLDVEGIRWLRHVLIELARNDVGILLSNHHMAEMELLADEIAVVAAGRLRLSGPVAAVLADAPPARLRLRSAGPHVADALRAERFVTTTARDGITVLVEGRSDELARLCQGLAVADDDVEILPPTLEDVFVEATRHPHGGPGHPHPTDRGDRDHVPDLLDV